MKALSRILLSGSLVWLSGCATLPEEEPMAIVSRLMLRDEFTGPEPGQTAPEFDAFNSDGASLRFSPSRKRPTLLVMGSYTCPIFRANVAGMRAVHRDYGGRIDMFYLLTTEAHPVGSNSPYRDSEWVTRPNRKDGVLLDQPETLEGRLTRARKTLRELDLPLPVLVDSMADTGWRLYGQAPSAAYVISPDGRVALRQGWVNPAKLDRVLKALSEESAMP